MTEGQGTPHDATTPPQDVAEATVANDKKGGLGWFKIMLIVLCTTVVATAISVWAIMYFMFPKELKPVTLNQTEEQTLNAKLQRLDSATPGTLGRVGEGAAATPMEPEKYSEDGANRTIELTEKELNALLAKNTDLADKLAFDLSSNLASATYLLPLDEQFPVLGGKTLKLTAGIELRTVEGKPVIVLKGISLWGVPLPDAWVGNLKNLDLVEVFGGQEGFWKSFAAGIEHIEVDDGKLQLKLNE